MVVVVVTLITTGIRGAGNDQVRALAGSVSQRHSLVARGVLRFRVRVGRVSHPAQPSAHFPAKHPSATGCTENSAVPIWALANFNLVSLALTGVIFIVDGVADGTR